MQHWFERSKVASAILVCGLTALGACSSTGSESDTGTTASSSAGTSTGGQGGQSAGQGGQGGQGAGTPMLVINEIMYDPKAVSDEAGEWVEIHNPTSTPVDLAGYRIHDQGSNSHVIANSVVIEPKGYVVLGRRGTENGNYQADYVYGDDMFLANSKDSIVLRDPNDVEIDAVNYESGAPWPLKTAGVSIELATPSLDNAQASSWQLAISAYGDGDLGTPGMPNGGTLPGDYTIDGSVEDWQQPALDASIHFAPLDPLQDIVLDRLQAAKQSIYLAFFNIRLYDVRQLLKSKHESGLDVHVILDKKQQDETYNTMGEQLVKDGVKVTLVERTEAIDATMHDKFAIIDGQYVMTGSANYSHTALNISDEDLVTIKSTSLSTRYKLEFDELLVDGDDKSAVYGPSDKIRAWMGPEDGLSKKVIDALDAAKDTIIVAMFQLNTQGIIDALIDAKKRGVSTIVILDKKQAESAESTASETLSAGGVSVVLAHNMSSKYAEMHSKFAVIDHKTAFLGSYNWTNLGSFYNDENILIIDDAHLAARTEGKFAEMLQAYGAPSPASLGLTEGSQTVSFDVRNVTLGPNETLKIKSVGSGPFDPPVALSGTSLSTSIEAGKRLEYRYEIHGPSGVLALESTTHTFTVPFAPGPFEVRDTFRP